MARAARTTQSEDESHLTPTEMTGTPATEPATADSAPTVAPQMTPDTAPSRSFDAFSHLRKIRTRQGMQDYLDVKWRVAWVRNEHPTAQIITEQIEGDDQHARFKCTITLPNGAIATGHGSETLSDFPDFYEKAETKAIGRACAILGFGTDSAADFDDGEPLDGRGAAKDERADRTRREASEQPPDASRNDHNNNVTPIAQGRTRAADSTPSRLPPTRRMPAPPVNGTNGSGTGTHGPAPTADDRSNIHQHTQLRALAENGFDLGARMTALGVAEIEALTREQAKELILEGRAATSGAHTLH